MSSEKTAEAAKDLIAEICDTYGDGNFIFRGTTEIFSGEPNGINSSLYRWAKKKKAITKRHKPPHIEKEIVEKARRLFPDQASNIEILTDLRHYLGRVNLIDFTRNLYVALFFACNDDFDKDGEIIVLDKTQLTEIKIIEYDKLKDGMIEPAKTQASQMRVVAQDSIFVYFVEGYIEKSNFENKKIPKELKKDILDFIRKFSNIAQDTIYNDLIGFIANEKNYDTTEGLFYQGNAKSFSGKYEEAIEYYSKAIALNPQFANAYNNRGNAKYSLGENEEAIKDYNQAIELNPQHASAYNNRGIAKSSLGDDDEAIQDYDKAIELNPKFVEAYCNLGVSKSSLGKYEEAIKDYNKAIELDPQYAEAYYNRGLAKEQLGDKTGAKEDLEKAKELEEQQKKK